MRRAVFQEMCMTMRQPVEKWNWLLKVGQETNKWTAAITSARTEVRGQRQRTNEAASASRGTAGIRNRALLFAPNGRARKAAARRRKRVRGQSRPAKLSGKRMKTGPKASRILGPPTVNSRGRSVQVTPFRWAWESRNVCSKA